MDIIPYDGKIFYDGLGYPNFATSLGCAFGSAAISFLISSSSPSASSISAATTLDSLFVNRIPLNSLTSQDSISIRKSSPKLGKALP